MVDIALRLICAFFAALIGGHIVANDKSNVHGRLGALLLFTLLLLVAVGVGR
jgi:hypothetical protein